MKQTLKIAIGAFALVGIASTGMMLSTKALAQDHSKDAVVAQQQQQHKEEKEENEEEEGQEALNLLTAPVKIDAASATALKAKTGFVNEAKLEEENGKLIWDMDVVTTDNTVWGVDVDAKTGKVLLVEQEKGDGDQE